MTLFSYERYSSCVYHDFCRELNFALRSVAIVVDVIIVIRKEVAFSRPDYLPTLSAAKTFKLSLLVKHHILAIDEASQQQQRYYSFYSNGVELVNTFNTIIEMFSGACTGHERAMCSLEIEQLKIIIMYKPIITIGIS